MTDHGEEPEIVGDPGGAAPAAPTIPGWSGSDLAAASHLLDNASVALCLLDSGGAVTFSNDSFALECGRPVGELIGSVLANSVVADDRVSLQELLDELFSASGHGHGEAADDSVVDRSVVDRSVEVRFVGVDGRIRPARLDLTILTGTVAAMLDPAHDPASARVAMCIATDPTEERRSEREQRKARVANLTASMTDPSTGLLNERGLAVVVESAARRATRNGTLFALIHCEMAPADTTEQTRREAPAPNDRSGDDEAPHAPLPDVVRSACVERMRQRLRPSDTIAQFAQAVVVLAEDLGDEQDAVGVSYRLLSTVVEPVPTAGGPVSVRLVAGTAMADGATDLEAIAPAAREAADTATTDGGFTLADLRS